MEIGKANINNHLKFDVIYMVFQMEGNKTAQN